MRRTALIGMNNPISSRPRFALWPGPVGSTGWNVWKMLNSRTGATRGDYVQAFHRYNLVDGGRWHSEDAARRWSEIESDLASHFDTIVLLGRAVQRAAGVRCEDVYISRSLVCIPHPSGLNRWYNSEINRGIVELILEELYTEAILA